MWPVKVNINVDANEIVRRAARHVKRHQLPEDGERKRKLLAMAKECAARLKLHDWTVVEWPPESVTVDIVDILASSSRHKSTVDRAKIAWQLSGEGLAGNLVDTYVAERIGIDEPSAFCDIEGKESALDVCRKFIERIIDGPKDVLRRAFQTSAVRFPLWAFLDPTEHPFPCWSQRVIENYNREWDRTCSMVMDNYKLGTNSHWRRTYPCDTDSLIRALDIYTTAQVAENHGYLCSVSSDYNGFRWSEWHGKTSRFMFKGSREETSDRHGKKYVITMQFVALQVAFQILTGFLLDEYVMFLHDYLATNRGIGIRTNKLRLKDKHNFNIVKVEGNKPMWSTFIAELPSRQVGQCNPIEPEGNEADCLQIMSTVLGGETKESLNIQLSVAHQVLGVTQVDRDTFIGSVNRRKVQLLKCGADQAIVIPYLNKIMLELKDYDWVRAMDVEALQPLLGIYNEGSVRRVANICLGFQYTDDGTAEINDEAKNVIEEHARRGELYSEKLRKALFAMLRLKAPVCIRALTVTAEKVFEADRISVTALVREMIHDLLHVKAIGGPLLWAFMDNTRDLHKYYFFEAYSKTTMSVEALQGFKNVDWISGVPVYGIRRVHAQSGWIHRRNVTFPPVKVRGGFAPFRGSKTHGIGIWTHEEEDNVRGEVELPTAIIGEGIQMHLKIGDDVSDSFQDVLVTGRAFVSNHSARPSNPTFSSFSQ